MDSVKGSVHMKNKFENRTTAINTHTCDIATIPG